MPVAVSTAPPGGTPRERFAEGQVRAWLGSVRGVPSRSSARSTRVRVRAVRWVRLRLSAPGGHAAARPCRGHGCGRVLVGWAWWGWPRRGLRGRALCGVAIGVPGPVVAGCSPWWWVAGPDSAIAAPGVGSWPGASRGRSGAIAAGVLGGEPLGVMGDLVRRHSRSYSSSIAASGRQREGLPSSVTNSEPARQWCAPKPMRRCSITPAPAAHSRRTTASTSSSATPAGRSSICSRS